MVYAAKLASPLGPLLVLSDGTALTGLYFEEHERGPEACAEWVSRVDLPVFRRAEEQLRAYFDGVLREFDLPLMLGGSASYHQVWQSLLDIPYGTTTTYATVARRLGRPDAVRAVAGAIGRNPISVIVPCHRVVGARGQLTGYAGGTDRKQYLLDLELHCSSPLD